MRGTDIHPDLRASCRVHARLLDGFIAQTLDELDRHGPGYVRDSLTELLDNLRDERKAFGTTSCVELVAMQQGAALGTAA